VTCLLDVNLLIALLWPVHEAHKKAQRWFAANADHGWATCPITQAGFVRIVSNPALSRGSPSAKEALAVLAGSLEHHAHRFWAEDIGVPEALAVSGQRLVGHQQVTDAYLLGLALHKKGKLATLDSSLPELLPLGSSARRSIVLV
jgi:uncharacterized protein